MHRSMPISKYRRTNPRNMLLVIPGDRKSTKLLSLSVSEPALRSKNRPFFLLFFLFMDSRLNPESKEENKKQAQLFLAGWL